MRTSPHSGSGPPSCVSPMVYQPGDQALSARRSRTSPRSRVGDWLSPQAHYREPPFSHAFLGAHDHHRGDHPFARAASDLVIQCAHNALLMGERG